MSLLFLLGIASLVWTSNGEFQKRLTEPTVFCYECTTYHLGLCYDGMRSCNLKYEQSCATENIYVLTVKGRSAYYYSKLSCMTNCEDINILGFELRRELICCKHNNYCNIPIGS
ncbi:hypothetical protein HJG60_014594 [Phyllostomus discolor]|uniref:UPAR/Ly6 domain-containing protein n=1 Tax=Phyllostomus discolor TaxID=89673 RepID=A0A834DGE8_9CHIR|nr:hypothetical protein HJG60_014594 [Phyllostomus discolor]